MELKIGDYGKILFEQMVNSNGIDRWESIREKAEPLVRELIKLNSEMDGGGYQLVGYTDETGKQKLPNHKRIRLSQEKLWKVNINELKKGDKIWILDDGYEMYIGENDPGVVDSVSENHVYLELYNWESYIQKINKKGECLRAPDDWSENEELYSSDRYWLEQADKLMI